MPLKAQLQPHQELEQRRFAHAVSPDDANGLVLTSMQTELLQNRLLFFVAKAHILHIYMNMTHKSPLP